MTGRIPSRGSDQFNLRLPNGMRDRLRESAEASGRSMNAEIIARLDESYSEAEAGGDLLTMARELSLIKTMLLDQFDFRDAINDYISRAINNEDVMNNPGKRQVIGELVRVMSEATRRDRFDPFKHDGKSE